MADTVKPTPFVFDDTKVKAKFATIEENVNKQQGKKGYNPFIWLNAKVNPLVNRYRKGERTVELQNAILALEDVPPVPKFEIFETPKTKEPSAELRPTGLKL